MDRLDRQILQALQLEGRAPFSRLAAVLGVSEQTIARRYRRLHTQGVVRVLGLIDPARQNQARWFVRAQCRPDAAAHLAKVLAARDDVSWVSLTAGGSEVTCATHTRRPRATRGAVAEATAPHQPDLLLHRTPAAASFRRRRPRLERLRRRTHHRTNPPPAHASRAGQLRGNGRGHRGRVHHRRRTLARCPDPRWPRQSPHPRHGDRVARIPGGPASWPRPRCVPRSSWPSTPGGGPRRSATCRSTAWPASPTRPCWSSTTTRPAASAGGYRSAPPPPK